MPSTSHLLTKRLTPLKNSAKTIRQLRTSLERARKTLKAETERNKQARRDWETSQEKHRLLASEFASLFWNLQQQLEDERRMAEVGRIITPTLLHDLNNLLAAISSFAQHCMEESIPSLSFMREKIQMIYETSRTAEKLIADAFDFIKTAKSSNLTYTQVSLNPLLKKMWKIARMSTGAPQILFKARFAKKLPRISADAEKLERVFLNLFLNAIEAVPKQGNVTVQTRYLASENMVETEIIDNGPGIPEEYRHQIFEPFFTTKKEGKGLGLTTCNLIVKQHGGEITVDSEERGGTRVRIRLPVKLIHAP